MRLMVNHLLQKSGKTKYWLAQQLGTSWQNVDKFVNNQTKSISYERIEALCEIFNCTPNDLFDYPKVVSSEKTDS